jgi:hypothetical protein
MQFGNVPASPVEKEMRSNGESKPQQNSLGVAATIKEDGQRNRPNDALISFPQNLAREEVLDTVLTAWTILIQRYQRDVFHQFTWGTGASDDKKDNQCIQTTDLDLSNQSRAGSLRTKLNSARSSNVSLHPGSSIFLNDGTSAEVSVSRISLVDHG